jgi:hypothetical protein
LRWFAFFIIRLEPGRMMKKAWFILIVYPGWRLRRSLTPGCHLSPFQGFRMAADLFYKAPGWPPYRNHFSSETPCFHGAAFPPSLRDGIYFLAETGDVVPG